MTDTVAGTASAASRFVPLEVVSVDRLTADAVAIGLRPPAGGGPVAWSAGQHLVLRRVADGAELRRTYSICSSAASGELRIAVKRLEGGAFSEWATSELSPGDMIEAMAPRGRFTPRIDPATARRYVAVAAGSGITPVFSIVATVLELEPLSTVALWYGNKTTQDVMLLEEICDLKDRFTGRFEALFFMSREEQDVDLFNGRLDGERARRLLAELETPAGVDDWFLCGPLEMVTDLEAVLVEAGVDTSRVHHELFHVDGELPRARRAARSEAHREWEGRVGAVNVLLNGRVTKLSVPFDGEPVLEALNAARTDAPYSCKSGVCGTCRARLVSGTVEMDVVYALEPDETDAGYVLMCQSHPTSDEVRLEVE